MTDQGSTDQAPPLHRDTPDCGLTSCYWHGMARRAALAPIHDHWASRDTDARCIHCRLAHAMRPLDIKEA